MIFTFGSNLAGHHGAGAALTAYRLHGAIYGQGVGPMGNSYGIPTKDAQIVPMALTAIQPYVSDFCQYAFLNPDLMFQVTRVGCGLAGFSDEQMAPLFIAAPVKNVYFDLKWKELLPNHESWGTF